MVNPGAFSGSRKLFLENQKTLYAAAVNANHVADTVLDIQRRYFKRFPAALSHDEEPTQEWLDQVDDSAPDPESRPPEIEDPDYAQECPKYHEMVKEIRLRKDQIKRRLQYQHNKDRDDKISFERGCSDPMAILMAKLTGETIKKPRMKTAYNVWGPEHRFFVDPVFKERVEKDNVPAKQQAALRSAVYKELFDELLDDERQEWVQRAEDEHRQALMEIEKKFLEGPLTSPEARQRVIQALPKFVEPILDLIAAHTGWKVTLVAGGPEPADGGRLNMVSIHSGVTSGSVKVDFGRSERQAYRTYIIPTFGTFLKKCYTIEECRSRALPSDNTAIKLATLGIEEDLDVHRFDLDFAHYNAAKNLPPVFKSQKSTVKIAGIPRDRPAGKESGRGGSVALTAGLVSTTLKYGPPIGRRKVVLRPLPSAKSKVASTPENAPTPSPFTTGAEIATTSVAACMPPALPGLGSSLAQSINVDALSCTPAPTSTPAPSRPPTPAPSRAPTPTLSRVPTPAPSRALAPALSRGRTPDDLPARIEGLADAPMHPNLFPTTDTPPLAPEFSESSTEATYPASATVADAGRLLATPFNVQSAVSPSSDPPTSLLPPSAASPTLPAHPAHTPPPSSTTSSEPHRLPADAQPGRFVAPQGQQVVPLPIPSAPATPIYTPSVSPVPILSTTPTYVPSSSGILKPSGAATVPDPSVFAAALSSKAKTRKRKVSEEEGDENAGRASKRTRSSAFAAAQKRKAVEDGNALTPKKQKRVDKDSEYAGVFDLAVPGDCPPWVANAVNLVASVDLGAQWQRLAAAWLKFEEGHGFKQDGRTLGNSHRPRIVSDWIRRARTHKYRPTIRNISTFKADFKAWWTSLQPDWRVVQGNKDLQKGGDDWESLQFPGQNGILSVVAALFFWGVAVTGSMKDRKEWDLAVDDVLYALTQLS